jgi:Collagen triple helix repeat (20 copies)
MFSTIRRRLTYANVAMTLALVFAMSGGAYAASKYLITSTKQISPKVLKALKGKAGPAGTNGTNGVNAKDGAQGPVGAVGAVGQKGDTGGIGATGPAGPKGATGTTGPAGTNGTNGTNGAAGATGPPGPEGVCSTANCVLPKGAIERGTWSVSGHYTQGQLVYASISFPIPLEKPFVEPGEHAVYVPGPTFAEFNAKEAPKGPKVRCEEGTYLEPKAAPGNLCVYQTLSGKFREELGEAGGPWGELEFGPEMVRDSGLIIKNNATAGVSGAVIRSRAEFTAPATEGLVDTYGIWVVKG